MPAGRRSPSTRTGGVTAPGLGLAAPGLGLAAPGLGLAALSLSTLATVFHPFGVLAALGLAACSSPAPPADAPEVAYVLVLDACKDDDPALLFDAFDTRTQWAIETVHKAQQEMRQLAREAYPPEARATLLAGLPAAADEPLERPRRYYRGLEPSLAGLRDIKRRMFLGTGRPVGSTQKRAGLADVWREGGSIFHFARDDKGRWGYAEEQAAWERARERALHDVEQVRKNAEVYRSAAVTQAAVAPSPAPVAGDPVAPPDPAPQAPAQKGPTP